MSRREWTIGGFLVLLLVAVFSISFMMAPETTEGEEAFGGTDAAVTEILEDRGVKPWFEPLFEPGSGEIESGLFALQAALGAGVLGFALGNMRGRNRERRAQADDHVLKGIDTSPATDPTN